MAPDEIGGRGDREPWLSRRWAVVALLVAAVTAASAAYRLTADHQPSASRPDGGAPASGRVVVPPAPASARWLVNDAVCAVHTDGRRLLVVRFILANRSGRDLVLDSVQPLLPRGGLRPQSTSTVAGDCHRWVPTDTGDGDIPSGGQRVVSMLFRLPPECPHPVAVRARVLVHAGTGSRTADLPVLDDLDGVAFASCPAEPLPQRSASGSS